MKSKIAVIAHRGASSYVSENTLKAFKLAVSQGATAVELDLRQTLDRLLVVAHDRGIKKGRKTLWIDKHNYLDLIKHGKSPLLKLEDVFKVIPKEILINIDMKQKGVERDLAKLIIHYGRKKSVVIDSYYPGSIILLRRLLPKTTLGFSTAMEDRRDLGRRLPIKLLVYLSPVMLRRIIGPLILRIARNCHCDIVNMPARLINKKNILLLHSIGVKVFVWRVDKEKMMRKLINLGVDGIKTGKPDLLKKVVNSL